MIYSFFAETLRYFHITYMGEFMASLFNSFLPLFGTSDAASVSVGMMFFSHCLSVLAFWLVGYVFLGVGLFTMAKRRKMKFAIRAFIPFASTYLLGKLVGEINFFGKKIKRLGLYAMLIEATLFTLKIVQDAFYLPILVEYFNAPLNNELFALFYGNAAMGTIGILQNNIKGIMLEYSIMGVSLLSSISYFVLLLFLFRNYAPKSSFLFIMLSVFGKVFIGANVLAPILVFSIRNNSCEEYRDFMRMKMHSMYGGGNPYQYDDGSYRDPYAYDNKAKPSEKVESPFSEYEDK